MKKKARVAVALMAVALATPAGAAPRVVERIVAEVDGRPVLLSEVEAARRVTGAEAGPALEELIDELLMFAEASRMPQAALTPEEEARALAGLAARAAGHDDQDAVARIARRQAVILKYVDLRFRPQVRVTDEAAADAAGAGGPPEDVERARRDLEARDLDRRIEAWIADLRQAARIRYNAVSGTAPASR